MTAMMASVGIMVDPPPDHSILTWNFDISELMPDDRVDTDQTVPKSIATEVKMYDTVNIP
jgi:hypothetical protein